MIKVSRSHSLFATLLLFISASGQSYQERFAELHHAEDADGQLRLLSEWRASGQDLAGCYVAFYNFHVTESRSSAIRIGTEPSGEFVLAFKDQDTTKSEPVGYIYDGTTYDPDRLATAFAYIDSGIVLFPRRLDMRSGKIYMLGEVEDYSNFTAEIIRTIEHGAATDYDWTWTGDEPLEDPKDFMYSNTQSYVYQLFESGDDALNEDMVRISMAVLAQMPDHVESLTTIAAVRIMEEEYDKALELLLRVETITPQDDIVTSNIAEAYKRKGETAKAIKYYRRTMEIGKEGTVDFARQQIEELKK